MQPQPSPYIVPLCREQITILYQDEHLLLINKPDLLLSLPGKIPENHDSVITRLLRSFPTASLVHRLDLDTSGIMIIPLSKSVNANLSRQFQERTIRKTYTALLFGHLENNEGVIDLPIAKDWQNPPLQKICHERGRQSQTEYSALERGENPSATRVLFQARTGRSHQLRIHSMAIGHPILGCDLYAHDEAFQMANRLMLHATTICFTHPVSGVEMEGISPSPF